ncbi:MAG: hypothetical protein ACAF41_08610 [Leptolyngbya sp. BL-A-14]
MHPDIAPGFWLGAFTFGGYSFRATAKRLDKTACFWMEVCYIVQNTRVGQVAELGEY